MFQATKPTLLLLSATLLLVRHLNNNCWGEFVGALFPSSRKSLCFSQWSWHLLSVPDTFYLKKEQKPWNNIKLILPWTESKEVFCFMSSVSGTRSNSGFHDTGGSEEKKSPNIPNRNRTYDVLVTSPDAQPLSHRTLVGAIAEFCLIISEYWKTITISVISENLSPIYQKVSEKFSLKNPKIYEECMSSLTFCHSAILQFLIAAIFFVTDGKELKLA